MNYILAETLEEYVTQFIIGVTIVYILDIIGKSILNEPKLSARWFFLHIFVNIIVVFYSYNDLMYCLYEPNLCFTNKWMSTMPFSICSMSHLYHMVMFKNLKRDDYLHHILMGPVLGLMTLKYANVSGANMMLMGFSGVPGGIDYILLVLVNLDVMKKKTEKVINVYIHVWIRAPYIIFCLGIWYSNVNSGLMLFGMIISFWNAQYFMHSVLASFYRKY